jgi:predicted nucleotidyltransferase
MADGKETGRMNNIGLSDKEQELIQKVLSHHADVTGAILFGSRSKGTAMASSDIDLALEGLDVPCRLKLSQVNLKNSLSPIDSMLKH